MGGIAGLHCFTRDLPDNTNEILINMREALLKRGGDNSWEWLYKNNGTRAIAFDGEIYNRAALRAEVYGDAQGQKNFDAELVLDGFIKYGYGFVNKIKGVFAFAVRDGDKLYLFRDHAGVKPLFYTVADGFFLFASEIKALLTFTEARLDMEGFCQLLALGPVRLGHSGILKNIYALPPGFFLSVTSGSDTPNSIKPERYWDLAYRPHESGEAETVSRVKALLLDAISAQTETNGDNICSFLSGGVDSSIITAAAASAFRGEGRALRSYSFDFINSASHFTANAYQPDLDRPWVEKMVEFCGTEHRFIECAPEDLAALLGDAVRARELPGMADIDASLLYFCYKLPEGMIALTGECADEVFGGYPWFHRRELVDSPTFPWSGDLPARKALWSPDILEALNFEQNIDAYYENAVTQAEKAVSNSGMDITERRLRVINYLTIKYFMANLAERMERVAAYAGISARVPFADKALMEYVFNIPWALKRKNGTVKYILREAARGLLPDEVLFRKKSPFPKTYDPVYFKLASELIREDVINDISAPIRRFLDIKQIRAFIEAPADVSRPWFGQLMAGPQKLAWLWQINFWLREYSVKIEI